MPTNYLTISRRALYDLVWSKPIAQVATEFGISELALKKRCTEVNVPLPPDGYWTLVRAGQMPQRPPLPTRREESSVSPDPPIQEPWREIHATPPPETSPITERTEPRADIGTIHDAAPFDLSMAHAAIKRTAVHLQLRKASELTWERGERTGPIVAIDVSDAIKLRSLRIADALLKSADAAGWKYEPIAEQAEARRLQGNSLSSEVGKLVVDGESFQFRIDERRRRLPHTPTEEEIRKRKRGEYVYSPNWDYKSTGELRLHLTTPDSSYAFGTRRDGSRKKLEDQIAETLQDLVDRAQLEKSRREERRLRELREREQQKLAWEQSQRRAEHAKLIAELERQAGAWHRAQVLRRYLRAARRAIDSNKSIQAMLFGQKVDFFNWAEQYVDQLDPLCSAPRNLDQQSAGSGHHGSRNEDLMEVLHRLTGQAWPQSSKLVAAITMQPDTMAPGTENERETE